MRQVACQLRRIQILSSTHLGSLKQLSRNRPEIQMFKFKTNTLQIQAGFSVRVGQNPSQSPPSRLSTTNISKSTQVGAMSQAPSSLATKRRNMERTIPTAVKSRNNKISYSNSAFSPHSSVTRSSAVVTESTTLLPSLAVVCRQTVPVSALT